MSSLSDPVYVRSQYAGAANLGARIDLHARFSTNRYGWFRWLFDRLDIPAEGRVLEVGCGSAALWAANAYRIPPGWQLSLTDLSPGMLDEAQRALSTLDRPITVQTADVAALPFPTGSFDAVLANHMLYHVPDRPRALAELRRVLRPGGRLYASTVSRGDMRELFAAIRRINTGADVREVGFVVEDGAAQLAPHFDEVRLEVYEDSLLVPEVEPLVAYVASGMYGTALGAKGLAELARWAEAEIAAHGAIHISKQPGLFTGTVKEARS
jgi:ubiquinone/menaquinone biosynthesis C-methylase UbiE